MCDPVGWGSKESAASIDDGDPDTEIETCELVGFWGLLMNLERFVWMETEILAMVLQIASKGFSDIFIERDKDNAGTLAGL